MFNLFNYLIFIPMIYISSFMIFISHSWFSQWMVMEINLLSFLGLIMFEKKINSDILMMYFLIQSLNSYLFIMMSMSLNFLNLYMNEIIMFLMNLNLLMKMGMPPFYIWYLKISKKLNWMNLFIFFTIQKIIPLMILNKFMNLNNLLLKNFNLICLILFSMIFSLMGLNMMNLKILMAYSSMIQMSWIIVLMNLNELMFMNYFLIYLLINYLIIYIFMKLNLNYLNEMSMLKFKKKWMNSFILISFLSLGGIPPFFGFLMKWISIQSMNLIYSFNLIILMIFNSLVSLFFYMRIVFLLMLVYSVSLKMNFLKIKNLSLLNTLINWMLLIMIFIYEIF